MIKKHYMDEFWLIPIYFKFMINIINIIKNLPRLATKNQLYRHVLFNNKTTYEVSFFRQSWRNK